VRLFLHYGDLTDGTTLRRKGFLWEMTAVPEIRVQAVALAQELLREAKGAKALASLQMK